MVELQSVESVACCGVTDTPIFLTPSSNEILSRLSPSVRLAYQLYFPDFWPSAVDVSERRGRGVVNATRDRLNEGFFAADLSSFCAETTGTREGQTTHWKIMGYVTIDAGLIASILAGRVQSFSTSEAAAASLADWFSLLHHQAGQSETRLDEPSNATPQAVPSKLGRMHPNVNFRHQPEGALETVSTYLVHRFGFSEHCQIAPSLPASVAGYLSFLPDQTDVGLNTTSTYDQLILPLPVHFTFAPSLSTPYDLLPNPIDPTRLLAVYRFQGTPQCRLSARDSGGSGRWFTFSKAINAVPFGASAKMDDKCFAFPDARDRRGMRRFEGGQEVPVFSDVRADPRVILEGQGMAYRDLLDNLTDGKTGRVYGWGKAVADENVAKLWGEVFGRSIVAGRRDVERAKSTDLSAISTERRPMLGAAMYAFYVAERRRSDNPKPFDSLIREAYGITTTLPHRGSRYNKLRSEQSKDLDAMNLVELTPGDREMSELYGVMMVEHRRLAAFMAKGGVC